MPLLHTVLHDSKSKAANSVRTFTYDLSMIIIQEKNEIDHNSTDFIAILDLEIKVVCRILQWFSWYV